MNELTVDSTVVPVGSVAEHYTQFHPGLFYQISCTVVCLETNWWQLAI